VKQGFLTGRGRVVLRGKASVETDNKNRDKIIIHEVPYQVNRDMLTDKIGQLVNEKIIEGISNVNNESNMKEGTRIVLDLKREAVPQLIINQLYKLTELQTSYGINNVALVRGRPRTLNLRDLISEFVLFRLEVVVRRTKYELRKAEERAHILLGYLIALDHLDEVIKLIRGSATPDIAREGLITTFGMSEIQARAVLDLRLQRLTGMERDKIRAEYDEIQKTIEYLNSILGDEALRFEIIKGELIEVKEKYGDARKTEIQYLADEISLADLIEQEDVVITISNLGYIKRTSASDFRQQRRGGRGAKASSTRQEDYIDHLFVANTHHTMLFFTEKGRVYWLKVYEIPEGDKSGKGRAIQNMMQIPQDDKVRAIIDIANLGDKEFVESHYIVLCTKQGIIKKTPLVDFSRPRSTGVNAITILEGDQLLEAKLTDGSSDILVAIKSGRAIRFPETKVRPTGRGAIGVTAIEVDDATDEVVGMICVNKSESASQTVLVVSEQGFGKKTPIDDYRITNRGGKGIKTINVTEKTGKLVGILNIADDDDLMISCKSGVTIRTSTESIRAAGRNTQGVKLIRLNANDEIAAITKLDKLELDEEEPIDEDAVIIADGEALPEVDGEEITPDETETPEEGDEETSEE
jgi:DNA gyrase subunit A